MYSMVNLALAQILLALAQTLVALAQTTVALAQTLLALPHSTFIEIMLPWNCEVLKSILHAWKHVQEHIARQCSFYSLHSE